MRTATSTQPEQPKPWRLIRVVSPSGAVRKYRRACFVRWGTHEDNYVYLRCKDQRNLAAIPNEWTLEFVW